VSNKEHKDSYMARLGHLGGKKGGPARAKVLSSKRRSEIAKLGGKAKAKKDGA
jgi:hypothetical protein